MRFLRVFFRVFLVLTVLILVAGLSSYGINQYIISSSEPSIKTSISDISQSYTAIVLGSKVYGTDRVSVTVKNRCDKAVELYNSGRIKRILVSGDHGLKHYDEVNAMKNYLEKQGIPASDIFLDHAGFNTYDTMVRAKEVFKVDDAVVVSQAFHLPRAIYIAQQKGLSVQGYVAEDSEYLNLEWVSNREKLARVKSFIETFINRSPKFLGEEIPITGNAFASHD